ncbi:MAG: DUF5615 family PIN-like protein [Planctomycetota bacterium]|jgi:predicted nuclease of predicted toxin-antitoxin system|nr:DUF5615 family PIN-like protein [Planctomycetota bacterium]RLS25774.1 MAG: hypothetical protein DWH73_01485 [Planctomycetota bacterium]
MKFLFDENLSYKLLKKLNDIFPEILQVRQLKLNQYDDRQIWEYAKSHSYVIVTQDVDFANLVALYGPPPKVIWIRCRNQSNQYLERLIRMHYEDIVGFEHDPELDCLELYPFDSEET